MNDKLETFHRLAAVEMITGIKRTKIREMMAAGAFPQPVSLSDNGRAIAWLESELASWQRARIAKRQGA
jgi:prophage regulatory protein